MRMWLIKELIRFHKLYVLMCLQREVYKSLNRVYSYTPTSELDKSFVQGEIYTLNLVDDKIKGAISKIRRGENDETQR